MKETEDIDQSKENIAVTSSNTIKISGDKKLYLSVTLKRLCDGQVFAYNTYETVVLQELPPHEEYKMQYDEYGKPYYIHTYLATSFSPIPSKYVSFPLIFTNIQLFSIICTH